MLNKTSSSTSLVHFVCQDYVGLTRGRGFPAENLAGFLKKGVGWVPANLGLNPFNDIVHTPWGSVGDLLLKPDPATEVVVPWEGAGSPLHYFLSDIVNLDGSAWEACPRSYLKRQIAALRQLGINIMASFEHEFMLTDIGSTFPAFSLAAARSEEAFCSELMAALEQAGVEPEMCLPEYAKRQYEVTCAPTDALAAADRAVTVREVLREVCRRRARHMSMAPVVDGNSGTNGVHIHLSLWSLDNEPLTYDAGQPGRLSAKAAQFAAGLLEHMEALTALTAPGVVSYQRLRPHSWSAAYSCIGDRNREAAVRIAPVNGMSATPVAAQANLEYRPADALASPYIALGALLAVGLDGLRRELALPELVDRDPASIPSGEHARFGLRTLPADLSAALQKLEADSVLRSSMGPVMLDCYRLVKQSEVKAMTGLDDSACRRAYAEVY